MVHRDPCPLGTGTPDSPRYDRAIVQRYPHVGAQDSSVPSRPEGVTFRKAVLWSNGPETLSGVVRMTICPLPSAF